MERLLDVMTKELNRSVQPNNNRATTIPVARNILPLEDISANNCQNVQNKRREPPCNRLEALDSNRDPSNSREPNNGRHRVRDWQDNPLFESIHEPVREPYQHVNPKK